MNTRSGKRTLLISVLIGATGPIATGISIFMGRSSTQIADFVRRCAEFIVILISFIIYIITHSDDPSENESYENIKKRLRLECTSGVFVGAAMCLGGGIMLTLAIISGKGDKGNVLVSFVAALMGVVTNTLFWRKYAKLSNKENSAVLSSQHRLYRAKTFVDLCIVVALSSVMISPESTAAYYLDLIGSVVVSLYLVYSGAKLVIDNLAKDGKEIESEIEDEEYSTK